MPKKIRRRRGAPQRAHGVMAQMGRLSAAGANAARATADGFIPIISERGGLGLPTLPLLGLGSGVAFGRTGATVDRASSLPALDQPSLAGETPYILLNLSSRREMAISMEELRGIDGLRGVRLEELDGVRMYSIAGFSGARALGALVTLEPADPEWSRLRQIEALAERAGGAELIIAEGSPAELAARARRGQPMDILHNRQVRLMRCLDDPELEARPGAGFGYVVRAVPGAG